MKTIKKYTFLPMLTAISFCSFGFSESYSHDLTRDYPPYQNKANYQSSNPIKGENTMPMNTTPNNQDNSVWDKTKEVSADAWDATKEGAQKGWDKTKEVSADAWDATKEGAQKGWDKTKEVSADAWDATKEGAQKGWDKTKEVSADAWDATKEGAQKVKDSFSDTPNNTQSSTPPTNNQ